MSVPTPKCDAALARLADERRYGAVTIAQLSLGDAVQDSHGTVGEVAGFGRDHVSIAWGEFAAVMRYTDAELSAAGVVRWSPVRKVSR